MPNPASTPIPTNTGVSSFWFESPSKTYFRSSGSGALIAATAKVMIESNPTECRCGNANLAPRRRSRMPALEGRNWTKRERFEFADEEPESALAMGHSAAILPHRLQLPRQLNIHGFADLTMKGPGGFESFARQRNDHPVSPTQTT